MTRFGKILKFFDNFFRVTLELGKILNVPWQKIAFKPIFIVVPKLSNIEEIIHPSGYTEFPADAIKTYVGLVLYVGI